MEFKSVEPEPIEKMSKRNPDWTICEELRKIWDLLEQIHKESYVFNIPRLSEEAMYRVRLAVTMAKKMEEGLREAKNQL